MLLHEDKFEYVCHSYATNSVWKGMPFSAECFIYNLSDSTPLTPTETVKDLGVVVSSDLSWNAQISSMASKGRAMSAWVFSAFITREKFAMMLLYKSLVRSHLEYCCVLWNPKLVSHIQLLESVQRSFTARIWGLEHLNYWERLKALKLMSLQRRRERYIIIHMWKILNLRCPNDVGISFSSPSRLGIRANIPTLSKVCSQRNQSIYDSSFAVMGPKLWNIIPSCLHQITDQQQFKIQLTTYLNKIPDEPPVPGYCCSNSNSILDWNKCADSVLQGRSCDPMSL